MLQINYFTKKVSKTNFYILQMAKEFSHTLIIITLTTLS